MFEVDITPNPLQIDLKNGSGNSNIVPNFIKLIDINDGTIRYLYVNNGILFISTNPPTI